MEVPNVWGTLALEMYSRTRSLFEAVRTLVDAKQPEEALMLVRELLEDSLRLMELEARPADRFALAFGWYKDTITRLEALGRVAAAAGLPRADEWPAAVARRRAAIKAGMQAHGVKKVKRFDDRRRLAEKHGRPSEDWDYRFCSEMSHRPDLAQSFRTRRSAEDTTQIYLRNDDPDFRALVLAHAMTSALDAHRAVTSMFGWKERSKEDLANLLSEVDHLFPEPPELAV